MAQANLTLWRNAQRDAFLIMGRLDRQPGRRGPWREGESRWKADADPLAWWCLTELLVSYAQGKKSKAFPPLDTGHLEGPSIATKPDLGSAAAP